MSEVVIFCDSYPQIKNTFYLIGQYKDERRITVAVTGNRDLFQFLQLANERAFHNALQLLYLDGYIWRTARVRSKIAKALYLLPDMVAEARYLARLFDRNFARFRGAKVFFFSRYFNAPSIYLLRRLSRNNTLIFMPEPSYDALTIQPLVAATISDLAYLARCKLVYGFDIVLGVHPLGPKTPCISDKFLRERVARVISPEERNHMLQGFEPTRLPVFDAGGYSIVYFDENLVEHGFIADTEPFERMLSRVFGILARYFSDDQVAIKYHPASVWARAIIRFGRVLPDFIPAEFFYHEKVKMYLDFASMALANVSKGLAVSLIDLVPFKDDKTREWLRDYLTRNSHSSVLFPRSLDEFEAIVKDIAGK